MKILPGFLILLSVVGSSKIYGQANVVEKAKYISRNQDFVERRMATGDENFASLYYAAHKEYLDLKRDRTAKKEFRWTPVGPMGKERLSGTGRINSMAFHPKDTGTIFICVAQGGIWKTTNSGASWTNISAELPIQRTSDLAIHPTNPDIMYAALGDCEYLGHNIFANENKRNTHYGLGVYKTEDGGETWNPTGLSFLQTDFEGSLLSGILIHPDNPNTVIAVGQSGSYLSTDSGDSWTNTHKGLFWDLKPAPDNADVLYASTGFISSYKYGESGILKSTDFGKTWKNAVVPFKKKWEVERIEIATCKSNPSMVYALACNANPWSFGGAGFHGIYLSTDGGATFSTRADSNYKYNMLGSRFDKTPGGQGRYDLAFYVDDKNAQKLHLGGVNVWTSTDGGFNFLPTNYWALNYEGKGLHADVHQIKQHPETGRFFFCHDGGLSSAEEIYGDPVSVAYVSPSTVWKHYTTNLNITSFYRLGLDPLIAGNLSAGAQDNSSAFLYKGNWFNTSGGDGMETVFNQDYNLVYTSSQYGFIYEQHYDEGTGEVYISNSHSPPVREAAEWTSPMYMSNNKLFVGYGNVFELSAFGSLIAISSFPNAPNRSFARPSTALHVNKTNSNIMYLAKRGYASEGTQGKVYHTFDYGTQWEDISAGLPLTHYPTYITADDAEPGRVWITFASWEEGEKIYYSENSGENWTNLSYNLPNIPVNCVVYQPALKETVYIGTDLGVFYLDEENKTWVPFNDGLPPLIVSELELDVTSTKLFAATFGRGIWEVQLGKSGDTTSLNELTSMDVNVFPNPITKQVQVQWGTDWDDLKTLRVLDITGREVYRNTTSTGTNRLQIDATDWLSGQYFVILETGTGRVVKEIQKIDSAH